MDAAAGVPVTVVLTSIFDEANLIGSNFKVASLLISKMEFLFVPPSSMFYCLKYPD